MTPDASRRPASPPPDRPGRNGYQAVATQARTQHTSFTLVELLVVIAIIAILASLLLPALRSAKEQVKVAECMNRQRQLFFSLMNYAADHDDWVPNNYHWLCDKYLHGIPADAKGYGLMFPGRYVEERTLYCPARPTPNLGNYWDWRQAGYCYYVPDAYVDGQPNARRRRLPLPWWPLNACRTDGAPAPLPHGGRGLVLLRQDGSAFFLLKPPWGGWGFSWDSRSNQKNWDPFSLLWSDSRIRP
jgi:prepilin-type N-terminal cleavage/methylation domain-containing protein